MSVFRLIAVVGGLLIAVGQAAAQTDSTGSSRLNGARSLDPGSSPSATPTGSGTPWTRWFLNQERWLGNHRATIGADGYVSIYNAYTGFTWNGGYTSGPMAYTATIPENAASSCFAPFSVGPTGWDANGAPTGWSLVQTASSWCY
jgi:hypothetical protein